MAEMNEQTSEKKDFTVLPGNEKSLTYKVLPVPKDRGRFGFTWDVLTHRLGKIVYVNLLMLVFFTPLVVLFVMRDAQISEWSSLGLFGDNLGIGYPASPDTVGMAEALIMEADTIFFAIAIALSAFAAIGIAGGVYCIRKLLRSDDELHLFRDFGSGIKRGYLSSLVACLLSFAMLFVFVRVWDYASYMISHGGSAALWIFFRVLACIALAIVVLFSLWLLSIGSNYKQNVLGILKNTTRLTFGTILQSVFFAVLMAAPALLFLVPSSGFFGGLLNIVAYAYFILIGFSTALLVWCSFNDWAYDNFADFTAVQVGAQEDAQRQSKGEEPEEDIFNLLLVGGKNSYLSHAVQPIEQGTQAYTLSAAFTADDLAALAQNKQTMRLEAEEYAKNHAEEEWYKEYNARFADREKALTKTDKKGKKKKFAPKMLNQ